MPQLVQINTCFFGIIHENDNIFGSETSLKHNVCLSVCLSKKIVRIFEMLGKYRLFNFFLKTPPLP